MPPRNRILALFSSTTLNGVDYVEIREAEPTHVYVHFLNTVAVDEVGLAATITGGDITPNVAVNPVQPADWSVDLEGRPVLRLTVPGRGDFSTYTLKLAPGTHLDPYFRERPFSFFVFCPSLTDCRQEPAPCPLPDEPLPPIDYLAKDFDSFVAALSDFSALRYPEWRERSEADFGIMMMEALSAIGDDLSYIQDEANRQGDILSATARRSIVRWARMVDYEPSPVMSARAILQLKVSATAVPAGARVDAYAPDGSVVPYEIGENLKDTASYTVDPRWNGGPYPTPAVPTPAGINPYWWDDGDRCLNPGSTSVFVLGHGFGFYSGQDLLIDTEGLLGDPPIRQIVTLSANGVEQIDPIFNEKVTLLQWRADDALIHHHDLTRTRLAGNLVPAVQGLRHAEHFAIEQRPPGNHTIAFAVARLGANSTTKELNWDYRYTIDCDPVGYLPDADGTPVPEVLVRQTVPAVEAWEWRKSLMDAGRGEKCFTLDAFRYRLVHNLTEGQFFDEDGTSGATIRFGNGDFGEPPNPKDVFEVTYRDSRGLAGLVPVDSITHVDANWAGLIFEATNPFASHGGADAETNEQVRRRAPQAFQSEFFRCVRPEDYNAAASKLRWVQRAGTVFRWTGSWPTIFVTADPKSAGAITRDQHVELSALLNRRRLAGYECYAPRPRYVSFDLRIKLCAKPDAYQGDVHTGLETALRPVRNADGAVGFFHFDNFTLGTPFERSRLEAAIQDVHGVAGVLSIQFRRRGFMTNFMELPPVIPFAPGEIFRLDNDNNHPERGSYRLDVQGGK